jgi:ATP-dependent exoDNAse (exonuclease V) alpha subunit
VIQAFASAAKQGALATEVRAQADRFKSRDDVIETRKDEYTTTGLLDCERALIEAASSHAAHRVAQLGSPRVERALQAAGMSLTADQASVVEQIAGSGDGVSVIQALAGTGKTYTAGALREIYEHNSYKVIGAAPTGRAARELAEQAGIPARTIDQLLIDVEQLGDALPRRCVLILDEAGMAATRPTARLLAHAAQAGAKVIAIGDSAQLPSVQAGGWFAALAKRLGTGRLTEVIRQRDPAERRVLAALHERDPTPYLAWAQQQGRIETFKDRQAATERALLDWRHATARHGLTEVVMIARDNDTRDRLNELARKARRAHGALGEEHTYGTTTLALGDRVICRRNDKRLDVDNGLRATVMQADEERVTIETDAGTRRELPARYVAAHVEHAYALTGHAMQGATVEHAIVLASPPDLTAGWSYTALSRARCETRLLVCEQPTDRAEFAPEDRLASPTRAELLARVATRMRERDDEDLALERLPRREASPDLGLGL